MRRTLILLALSLATAVPVAHASSTYSDLRERYPSVDAAIAALPSSGLNGTLSRISAELDRVAGRELTPSAERRLAASLETLERQLRAGLPSLSIEERLVLAQVVERVAVTPVAALYSGVEVPDPCPADHQWGGECHPPTQVLADRVAALVESSVREGFASAAASAGAPPPSVPPAPPGGISSTNLDSWIQDVLEGPGAATGVESIDD